jgi:uncharacterized membrane protein
VTGSVAGMRQAPRWRHEQVTIVVLGTVTAAAWAVGMVLHHETWRAMYWLRTNLILAGIAPVLATGLALVRRRGPVWWVALAGTVLLLPNTPYLLTDVIHVANDTRAAHEMGQHLWPVALSFASAFVVGIVGYAYILALAVADLRRQGRGHLVWPMIAATDAVCALGVWLGRVPHLNSWDVAKPDVFAHAVHRAFSLQAGIEIGFVFLVAGAAAVTVFAVVDGAARRVLHG